MSTESQPKTKKPYRSSFLKELEENMTSQEKAEVDQIWNVIKAEHARTGNAGNIKVALGIKQGENKGEVTLTPDVSVSMPKRKFRAKEKHIGPEGQLYDEDPRQARMHGPGFDEEDDE